jgi:TM2 domain-containing membrane protein YozV
MPTQTQNVTITKTLSFYQENGIWFANLPAFLNAGLGTKANLMMVDGADTFLDYVSNFQKSTTLKISTSPFEGLDAVLEKIGFGLNQTLLDQLGHAKVNYGAYYHVNTFKGVCLNQQLWLCPVTEYVFEGYYPKYIYIQLINNQ